MKKTIPVYAFLVLVLIALHPVYAQDEIVDRLSVAFSDPDKPGYIEAGLINGGITIMGYEGKEVLIEARTRIRETSERRQSVKGRGMIQIPVANTGLTVEERRNRMEISVASHARTIDLNLQVPNQTSLKLSCINSGDIRVEDVIGDIEVKNINGEISLLGVSGSVVAYAHNKRLVVTLDQVDPEKVMSFGTFNDDVDITLPADLKAKVKIKSDRGSVYSDFNIERIENPEKIIERNTRKKDGRYEVRIENTFYGIINGGGPEFTFKSYNGDIFIRKQK